MKKVIILGAGSIGAVTMGAMAKAQSSNTCLDLAAPALTCPGPPAKQAPTVIPSPWPEQDAYWAEQSRLKSEVARKNGWLPARGSSYTPPSKKAKKAARRAAKAARRK